MMSTGRYVLTFLFLYLAAGAQAQTIPSLTPAKENLNEYVGTYLPPYISGLAPMEISKKDDKLFYSFKGASVSTELKFISPAKYTPSDKPKTQIEFLSCMGWEATHLYVRTGGTEQLFIKHKPRKEVTAEMPAACKTVTVTACVNYEVNLHIKNNTAFWEILQGVPPGTCNECAVANNVNGKPWKNWKTPYNLDLKTDDLTVQAFVLESNDYAELIQAPSASNGWETVMHFLDLHRITHPHTYSVVFYFCPPGAIKEPTVHAKTKDPYASISIVVDTLLYKRVNIDLAAHKLFFEPGKTELTPAAKLELKTIYDTLKITNKSVEIIGYEKKGSDDYTNWKLYYERSLSVSIYLINIGLDQKRIRFFGYGEDDKVIERDLKERIKVAIKERQ
jgi:flagellar motor protein MotB